MEVDLRFSLKDVCALTGVSHQSIRMYEKWGVLPKITEDGNGYRYYHYPDLQRVVFLRHYASLGVPIKAAAALINGAKVEAMEQALDDCQRQAERQIRFGQATLESLRRHRAMLDEVRDYRERCEVVQRPAMYRLSCAAAGKIDSSAECVALMKEWAELSPVTLFSGISSAEDTRPDRIVNPGYAIYAEHADLLSTIDSPYIRYFPPAKTVRSILRISSQARDFCSMGRYQAEFCRRNGYRERGDILSVSIANKALTDGFPDDPSDYVCSWTEID